MFYMSRDDEIAALVIEKRRLLDRVQEIDRRFLELEASPDLASNLAYPRTLSQRILEVLALSKHVAYCAEDLAGFLGSTTPVVRVALHRLVKAKQIKRRGTGRFAEFTLTKFPRGAR